MSFCCAFGLFFLPAGKYSPPHTTSTHTRTHDHLAPKQTLLQNLYTEFDTDNRRIGFAPAAADCRKAVGL